MGKWTSEEHLYFYTFIIFNYRYIFKKKIKLQKEGPEKSKKENSVKVVRRPTKGKKPKQNRNKRRGKQLSGEFYTKMEEFFEDELPDHKKRTRSQLRCKMNKIFPKEVKEGEQRRKERWENGAIYFSDLVNVIKQNPDSLHVSGYEDKVFIPFNRDCGIIERQIEMIFGISFRVEEIKKLDQKKFNDISWRDFHTVYYPKFRKFVKEMTRQKEIFRRDTKFLKGMKEEDKLKKQADFASWMELIKNVILKTERGLLYLSSEYKLLSDDKRMLRKFKKSSSLSMKKKSKSSSKSQNSNRNVKVTQLKKRKKISRFSTSLGSKKSNSSFEKNVGFQKTKKKMEKSTISGFKIGRLENPIPKRKIFAGFVKQEEDSENPKLKKMVKIEFEADRVVSSFRIEKFQEEKKKLMNVKIESFERHDSGIGGPNFRSTLFKATGEKNNFSRFQ